MSLPRQSSLRRTNGAVLLSTSCWGKELWPLRTIRFRIRPFDWMPVVWMPAKWLGGRAVAMWPQQRTVSVSELSSAINFDSLPERFKELNTAFTVYWSVSLICNFCRCKANVGGRKCDRCLPGYYGFAHCYECACETKGTTDEICEATSAACKCKVSTVIFLVFMKADSFLFCSQIEKSGMRRI